MIYISREKVSDIYIPRHSSGCSCDMERVPKGCRLQEKRFKAVENGVFGVVPDDGFHGLEKVVLDVDVPTGATDEQLQEKYDEGWFAGNEKGRKEGAEEGRMQGYGEGYEQGKTEGKEEGIEQGKSEQKSLLEELNVDRNGTYEREDGYSKVTVNVPTGSEYKSKRLEVSANGTYNAWEEDVDGFSQVDVHVPEKELQEKTVEVSTNGTTTIRPDGGYDGMSEVSLTVNVDTECSEEELNKRYEQGKADQKSMLGSITVKENGTYDSENGYSSVKCENSLLKLIVDGAGQPAYTIKRNEWPEGMTSIRPYAFARTSVMSLEWPEGIKEIGEYAFYLCGSLNMTVFPGGKLQFPSTVERIGRYAFASCTYLTNYNIPEGITEIPEHAFSSCGYNENTSGTLMIPDSVEQIGDYAFYSNRWIRYLHVGKGLKSIGSNGLNFDGYTSANNDVSVYFHSVVPPTVESDSLNTKSFYYDHTIHYPVGSDYSSLQSKFPNWKFVEDITD